MKSFRLLAPVVLGAMVSVAGCSSSADNEEKAVLANMGAQQLYERAKQSMEVGNFSAAAQTLSALDSRYPFGPLSHQVQLDLIYSYYKSGKNEETIATIDRFIRLNPNHSDVDYAYYMRGLTGKKARITENTNARSRKLNDEERQKMLDEKARIEAEKIAAAEALAAEKAAEEAAEAAKAAEAAAAAEAPAEDNNA